MKYGFETPLVLANSPRGKTLVSPLVYLGFATGKTVIPAGFPTDLASFSIGNLALRGNTEEAAVLHDWLYAVGVCSRAQADAIFREALKNHRVGFIRRNIYWIAVRLGGRKPWRAHRKGWTVGSRFVRNHFGTETDRITNHP